MAVGRVIGWIFFLAIGWIFFLTGLAVLVRDYKVLVDTGHWWPIALGQLWWEFNPSSLNLVRAVTLRYIHPFLWDPVIVSVLLCWASAVLMVLGLVILRLGARGLTLRTLSAHSGPVAGLSSRSGPASGPTSSPAWSAPNILRPSAPGGAASGQRSTVDTPCIRMHLDHETGMVSGRVLRGAFAGARIEEFDLAGLLALLRECVAEGDEGGAQLIEKYLDGVSPDWRDELYRPRASAASPGSTADMTDEEAYKILGLHPGADKAAVREAWRRLIKPFHTDQGGTDYLASKINRARDVLLRQIAGQAR
jgi:hypothetical protein